MQQPSAQRPRAPRPQRRRLVLPVRLVLIVTCIIESMLIVPNLLAELGFGTGVHVPIVRVLLFLTRLAPLFAPRLRRWSGRWGAWLWERLILTCSAFCGGLCTSVEPSRGLSTALAGWYLICTPMHTAFSANGHASGPLDDDDVTQRLVLDDSNLVPCAIIMGMNVILFLCDALMLTVAPMLQGTDPQEQVQHVARATVFSFSELFDEVGSEKFSPTCVVCLADFGSEDRIARLPCNHVFHADCIGEWLCRHSACPLRCAGNVLPPLDMLPGIEPAVTDRHAAGAESGLMEAVSPTTVESDTPHFAASAGGPPTGEAPPPFFIFTHPRVPPWLTAEPALPSAVSSWTAGTDGRQEVEA